MNIIGDSNSIVPLVSSSVSNRTEVEQKKDYSHLPICIYRQEEALPSDIYEEEHQIIKELFGRPVNDFEEKIVQFYQLLFTEYAEASHVREWAAELIFLAKRNVEKTASYLDFSHIQESIERITTAFDEEVRKTLSAVQDKIASHQRVDAPNLAAVITTHKALAVAKMLVGPQGILNVGLIKPLKKHLISPEIFQMYKDDLLGMLEELERSPVIREKLRKVRKPSAQNGIGLEIVRISLGLGSDAPVVDQQVRVVLLAAFLSSPPHANPRHYFASLASVLKGRAWNNTRISKVSFVISALGIDLLRRKFTVDRTGRLLTHPRRQDIFLWEEPGTVAAARQIGIGKHELEGVVRAAIAHIYQQRAYHDHQYNVVTLDELIEFLIFKTRGRVDFLHFDTIKSSAFMAFSSETIPLLVSAEQSSLAALIKTKEGDQRIQEIAHILKPLKTEEWLLKMQKCHRLQKELIIPRVIEGKKTFSVSCGKKERDEVIIHFMQQPSRDYRSFMCRAVAFNESDNNECVGNVAFLTATRLTPESAAKRPRSAHELLEAFMQIEASEEESGSGFILVGAPLSCHMMSKEEWITSNLIAPGMLIAEQSLTESQKTCFINFVKSQFLPKELHRAFGLALKKSVPEANTVHGYSRWLVDVIGSVVSQTTPEEGEFNREVAAAVFKSMSQKKLRIENGICSILVNHVLSMSARKKLFETIVRIARMKWSNTHKRATFFACFFNPVSNNLSLCTVSEDDTHFFPLDQEEWLSHIPWEAYGLTREVKNRSLRQIPPLFSFS